MIYLCAFGEHVAKSSVRHRALEWVRLAFERFCRSFVVVVVHVCRIFPLLFAFSFRCCRFELFFFFLMLHFHSERHQEWHSNIIILYSYIQIINIGMMRSVASVESISGYMMRFYSPLAYTYIHYYYHTYISCSICCIYNFTCVCVYGLAPWFQAILDMNEAADEGK